MENVTAGGATPILRITFQNEKPIELVEYTRSLISIASEFSAFSKTNNLGLDESVKLYIKEVKSGSIISDLMALTAVTAPIAGALPSVIDTTKTIWEYYKHLTGIYDWLLGRKATPIEITKNTYRNIIDSVAPNISDNNGSIQLDVFNVESINIDKIEQHYHLDNASQNIIQNKARNELERTEKPETGEVYNSVAFYWQQTSKADRATSLDKGIIEAISQKAVKIITTDEIKKQMICGSVYENIYIINVTTIAAKGKIVAYNITDLIDIIIEKDNN